MNPACAEMQLEGGEEPRASRKHAPKTRRASATRALTTRRSREGLVARAAARRSSKAGHIEATLPVWARRARARQGEKGSTVAGGSPPVTAAKVGGAAVVAASGVPGSPRTWREGKIGGTGGSLPVAPAPFVGSRSRTGAAGGGRATGPSTADADGGIQNCTSTPLARRAWGREAVRVLHSAWQAGVMSSPFQLAAGDAITRRCPTRAGAAYEVVAERALDGTVDASGKAARYRAEAGPAAGGELDAEVVADDEGGEGLADEWRVLGRLWSRRPRHRVGCRCGRVGSAGAGCRAGVEVGRRGPGRRVVKARRRMVGPRREEGERDRRLGHEGSRSRRGCRQGSGGEDERRLLLRTCLVETAALEYVLPPEGEEELEVGAVRGAWNFDPNIGFGNPGDD